MTRRKIRRTTSHPEKNVKRNLKKKYELQGVCGPGRRQHERESAMCPGSKEG